MIFNINNKVKVKLTAFGIEVYTKHYESINKQFGQRVMPTAPKIDSEGYYSDQLWHIMRIFGCYMTNITELPFETEIIIIKGQ